jgi:hypothetical protein
MPQPGLSDVDICSLALRLIGSKPFQSFSDNTPQASLMNALYPLIRDQLLRSFPWKFAIKRTALSQLSISVYQFLQVRLELPTGKYVYGLPADFLRIIETDQDPSPYKIESVTTNASTNAQSLVLLSDNQTIGIRYISRITTTTFFDPNFTMALIAQLAMEAALPETGDLKKQSMAKDMYGFKLQEARLQGSIEDSPDTVLATYLTTDVR